MHENRETSSLTVMAATELRKGSDLMLVEDFPENP